MWGDAYTPARVLSAVEDMRFQLGQSDRFREGLVRSGLWQAHIEQTLADLGLPPELGVLPHVESSFNAAAYSKAGAAGMWQFMRSTGRRYMRIDSAVDDRMDPFRSTEAAAQLLSFNYRLLGTWPLALTAYNHGAEGMRRAKEQVGTDDIVMVVRNYHSPSFGFASRNYYVSFLAALTVDKNPEKYFGPIKREPEAKFQRSDHARLRDGQCADPCAAHQCGPTATPESGAVAGLLGRTTAGPQGLCAAPAAQWPRVDDGDSRAASVAVGSAGAPDRPRAPQGDEGRDAGEHRRRLRHEGRRTRASQRPQRPHAPAAGPLPACA